MFHQSFANSERQQRRRQERLVALQRMEDAARIEEEESGEISFVVEEDKNTHPAGATTDATDTHASSPSASSSSVKSASNFLTRHSNTYRRSPSLLSRHGGAFSWDPDETSLSAASRLSHYDISDNGVVVNLRGRSRDDDDDNHDDDDDIQTTKEGMTRSRRYRDIEGERLLGMASQRLSTTKLHSNEHDDDRVDYEPVILENEGMDDDNLFMRFSKTRVFSKRKRILLMVCGVVLILAIVVGIQVVWHTTGSSSVDDAYDATATATEISVNDRGEVTNNEQMQLETKFDDEYNQQRFDHIRYTLLDRGASNYEVFLDNSTAQHAALMWLTHDDPRQLDPESVYLEQRYGLAVLWFGTSMNGHERQTSMSQQQQVQTVEAEEEATGDGRRLSYNRSIQAVKDPNTWFRHENWLTSEGICNWEGIQCQPHSEKYNKEIMNNSMHDGDVSSIELRRNNLHGTIPDELYTTLPFVKVLDLSDNGLAGVLSTKVARCNRLETLNLTANNIAGSVVTEIGELTLLKELHLKDNLLEYSIPESIGNMSSLRHLDLSGNSINGTIPKSIGQLSQLSILDLSWNLLFGTIPYEISNLQTLVKLDISHNNIAGPFIAELGYVTYLEILRLNNNHFTGEIPIEIGNLIHLNELRLNNNDFDSTLPGVITNLIELDSLNVANNHFVGTFPLEWTTLSGLQELDVSSNELMGNIPVLINDMKNLRSLNMAHNVLTGAIPSAIGKLYKLEYLYLDDNELTSTVPNEFGELTELKTLTLHNNNITGSVGASICKLANELFLAQLSVDCDGELPEVTCDCCICPS
jgi:Leucine-rich repeat (LRR) protein